MLFDLLAQGALEAQHRPDGLCPSLGSLSLEPTASTEHRFLDLLGDDRPHGAEVISDLLDLERGPHQELEVPFEFARRERVRVAPVTVAPADEVVDQRLALLAVAVDSAVALLQAFG